jgi:competence protein ComEC
MKQRESSAFSTSDTPPGGRLAKWKKNSPTHVHRRPALILAILFIAGIALAGLVPSAIRWWIAASAAALLIVAVLNRYHLAASVLLAAAIIFGGIAAEQLDRSAYPNATIANFTTDQPRLARLRLRITDPPRDVKGQWHQSSQIANATVLAVQCYKGWQPADGDITLHLYNSDNTLHLGQRIEALGWLSRPLPADNPGEFDWLSYYRHLRILANFQITDPRCLAVLGNGGTTPLWFLRQHARELLLRGFDDAHALEAAVLDALVLGDRQTQERDIQDLFIQTGTPHLMVISGMHIFIVAVFIYFLCRLMRIRPRISAIIVMGCVILYGVIVLPSLPAARAVMFCVLTLLGIIFRRSVDLLQLLAICAIVILVVHPMDLSDAGFQLSFVTVFVLIVYGERITQWMLGLRSDFADAGASILDRPRENWIWRHIRNSLVSAGIAWLAILPLILFYFNRLNPWAIFGGISLLPFVFLGVIGGLAKILLTWILPWFAAFWATLAAIPIHLLIKSVTWLAILPASDVLAPAPSIWIIAVYYALLLLPLIPWRAQWKFMRLTPLCGLALLALPWAIAIFHPVTEFRLTILSVGAGSCAIAESPDGHVAIFDAGSSTIADLERSVIKPFLRQEQIRHIDDIFISHPDADHYNAVQPTIDDFDTHEVLLDGAFTDDARGSYGATRLLNWLDQMNRSPRIVATGEQINLGRDVAVNILWPPAHSNWGHNDDSMVQQIRYAGRTILIPADIESIAERQLINLCPSLPSDVLIAPHHGSSVDTTPFFIKVVNPQCIISSNDRTPTSKQKRFLGELDGRPLYATDKCGAVTITIDSHGRITITPFLFQLQHP